MPLNRLAALTALLVCMLTLVGLVQWRQSELISQATLQRGDDKMHLLFQAEFEYLRLRNQWVVPERSTLRDHEALRMRYEIFVSRIEILRTTAQQLDEPHRSELLLAISQVDVFLREADRRWAVDAPLAERDAALMALVPLVADLETPMRSMTLQARRINSAVSTQRNRLVQRHFEIGIALTLFLSVLTAVLGAVMIRLLARGERRRRELEDLAGQLRQARSEAEAASAAKTAFLANMSHEIRTPFQGVIGMLALLEGSPLQPQQQQHLRTAQASADHLLALLNDILDLSRLESGRMVLTATPTELATLLQGVDTLMRPLVDRKGLSLVIAVDAAVPRHLLLDAVRVRQVLFNLVGNAIKFTQEGRVEVSVATAPRPAAGEPDAAPASADPAAGQRLLVEVRDTGIGMSAATLGRLFSRYSQADDSLSRRFGGAGLGLEISRSLARLMGGDITVDSALGQGSIFRFTMPLQAVEVDLDGPLQVLVPQQAAAPPPGSRPLRILVAEDNEVNRLYMQALLERLGHEPDFACDGQAAVDLALATDYDLVLMDLHMPGLDGYGATRAIRAAEAQGGHRRTIAALTADAFEETGQRCREAGMDDFLVKPLRPDELRSCLERLSPAVGPAALATPAPRPTAALAAPAVGA